MITALLTIGIICIVLAILIFLYYTQVTTYGVGEEGMRRRVWGTVLLFFAGLIMAILGGVL